MDAVFCAIAGNGFLPLSRKPLAARLQGQVEQLRRALAGES